KHSIVTVEEIVDDLNAHPNACVIPRWALRGVAVAEKGALPSYTHGYYGRSNRFYKEWDAIARDRDTFTQWLDDNVFNAAVNVGGQA
ncbi:MAG: CoA transferase subunit A, partial [Halomonas sp.]|nr:CoA transferase subunit A [Halomonas sp.]